MKGVVGEWVGTDHGALGQFELELLRMQSAVGERLAHVVDQALVSELSAGQVDADEWAFPAGAEPGEGLAAGLLQHMPAEDHDEPRLFGQADEAFWAQQSHARMIPADQRLDPAQRSLGKLTDWLVVHDEVLPSQRLG